MIERFKKMNRLDKVVVADKISKIVVGGLLVVLGGFWVVAFSMLAKIF
jgi:hypothetical protein